MMDIYSDHRVSFNAGVWARANKFHPVSVEIARKLQSIAILKEQRDLVEQTIEVTEEHLRQLVTQAEQKQKEKDNA